MLDLYTFHEISKQKTHSLKYISQGHFIWAYLESIYIYQIHWFSWNGVYVTYIQLCPVDLFAWPEKWTKIIVAVVVIFVFFFSSVWFFVLLLNFQAKTYRILWIKGKKCSGIGKTIAPMQNQQNEHGNWAGICYSISNTIQSINVKNVS